MIITVEYYYNNYYYYYYYYYYAIQFTNRVVIKRQFEYLVSGRPTHYDVYNGALCLVQQLYVLYLHSNLVYNILYI